MLSWLKFNNKVLSRRNSYCFAILTITLSAPLNGCAAAQSLKKKVKSLFTQTSPQSKNQNEASSTTGSSGTADVTYEYFEVKKGDLIVERTISGKLVYKEQNLVRADKRMKLTAAQKKIDDIVKKGDVLLKVDTKEFEAKKISQSDRLKQTEIDFRSAVTQLEFNRKQLDRRSKLAAQGIAAKKDLEETERQVKASEINVQSRELEFQKAKREYQEALDLAVGSDVVAPIDGIVTSISRGNEDVGPGQIVAAVAVPGQLQFQGVADESTAVFIEEGKTVSVSLPANRSASFAGKISNFSVTQNDRYGQKGYSFTVDIPSELVEKFNLRDGYEAIVTLRPKQQRDALVVPLAALQSLGENKMVLVASAIGASATARAVKTGSLTDLEAEIVSGLNVGDVIAVPNGGTR